MQDAERRKSHKGATALVALVILISTIGVIATLPNAASAAATSTTVAKSSATHAVSNITTPAKRTIVQYTAAKAYLAGGTKIDTRGSGYSSSGYVDGYTSAGAKSVFSVNVPASGTYAVTLHYANGSGATQTLKTAINGISAAKTSLAATASTSTWANQVENLTLRSGLNTISLAHDQGDSSVSLDYVSVADTTALATQGATLPYTEYEAENAATNGTIIGPNYTYLTLPSEASGREAVQLTSQGQYVEFTLTQPANAVALRYSIPDSSDGSGLTAPLSLYVGGTFNQSLSLTSKYSWFYGSYPFTNTPGNGNAHHFYDEVHAWLGGLEPIGTKVRVQIDSGDTAPSYTIDLADFYDVPAAYTEPSSGYLSVTSYGADPTGVADSTQAIQNAVNAAESAGEGVWVPAGTYTVTSHIILNNVTMRGAGPWYTTLGGNDVGLYGNYAPNPSSNVQIYDLAIFGQVTNRDDSAQVNGIGGSMGGGSVIQDVWIEHTKVGMWFDGPFSNLLITGDTIRDTTADGINFHDGITNATVEQTTIRNTGDDGLAMWSDTNADQNDVFEYNTVQIPILANNLAIYGGSNNSILNNIAEDTLTEGGGIQVGNRFSSVPLAGTTTIDSNLTIRAGQFDPNWQFGVGAIWFYALDEAMTGTINVTNDQIENSPYEAIQFIGSSVTNVNFNNITVTNVGTFVFQLQAAGSATASNVTATGVGDAGQYNCGVGFTITQGSGNAGWSSSVCGFPTPGTTPTPAPTATATPIPVTPTPVPTSPVLTGTLVTAINAGGTASGNFVADTDYNQGNEYSDTSTAINTSAVGSPAPQAVYQTCRWNSAFTYTIPGLTAGTSYTLQLDWAELTFQSAGLREFNVAINGSQVLSNFDVYATAGYKTALAKQYAVTANSSGQIVIAFSQGAADNPFISGIEVWQPSGGTVTPTPTATTVATPTPTATTVVTPTPTSTTSLGTLVTALNAGGAASGNFVADTDYNQGNAYSDTSTAINTSGVSNAAPQAVYQTCRWNSAFTYTIPGLTAGKTYTVQLDWAELTFQSAGQRKFNVAINGSQILSNFDVYATAGYKTALAKQYSIAANSSGQIVIAFSQGAADNPFISGIEIYVPGTSSTITPTPVPGAGTLVTALNAGGAASGSFVADTDYNQGNAYSDTSTLINTSGVINAAPQAVYQTCRWNSAFTYTIPGLTAGKVYTVQLDWAELTFQGAGQREFNVAINGSQVLSNFDVYTTAGYKTALEERFTATANSSGQIVIAFTQGAADNPFISGIEIYNAS